MVTFTNWCYDLTISHEIGQQRQTRKETRGGDGGYEGDGRCERATEVDKMQCMGKRQVGHLWWMEGGGGFGGRQKCIMDKR